MSQVAFKTGRKEHDSSSLAINKMGLALLQKTENEINSEELTSLFVLIPPGDIAQSSASLIDAELGQLSISLESIKLTRVSSNIGFTNQYPLQQHDC